MKGQTWLTKANASLISHVIACFSLPVCSFSLNTYHFSTCHLSDSLTCVPSFKHHLSGTSSILSHLFLCPSCLCLHAWVAAVNPASPSLIRGQCRNRCITHTYPTREHFYRPSTHLSSMAARIKRNWKTFMILFTEKQTYTFHIYITTTLTCDYTHRKKRMIKNTQTGED